MSSPANFDRLASTYRWMEYLSFGPYLKQCRELRLDYIASHHHHALIYGDGDARFLSALVRRAPRMRITTVDASRRMLRQAARRLPRESSVRLVHADALHFRPAELPEAPFDLVISHFFLDCFNEQELTLLLQQVHAATRAGTRWVVSDFAIPQPAILRILGRWIVHGLYLVFGILTGLKTRRLPDHARVMRAAGWILEDQQQLLFGLLINQQWRRAA